MSAMRRLLAGALVLGLAACGTLDERGGFAPTFDQIQARVAASGTQQADARASVTPALVNSIPTSVAFFESIDPNTDVEAAGMLLHTVLSDPGRWSTADGRVVFILKGGLPLRSHGLGFGMANANIDPTLAALASGTAQTLTREQRYLDGENHEVIRSFTCEFTPEGRETITVFDRSHETHRFLESCSDEDTTFQNRYWRGADGILWRSETWLSPRFGRLRLERLSVVSGR